VFCKRSHDVLCRLATITANPGIRGDSGWGVSTDHNFDAKQQYGQQKGRAMTTEQAEVLSTEECAAVLIDTVKQLRAEAGIAENQAISLYVPNAQLIRSTLAERGDEIRRQINAVDVVQVNVRAGIPMPAHIPQVELHNLDESPTTIGIDVS
jgi:hypothetical protein